MTCAWAVDTDAAVTTEATAEGEFWSARWPHPVWRRSVSLGRVRNWRRCVALYRSEPFWMRPKRFTHVNDVPRDTQLLLVELTDGSVLLIAPLARSPFHTSLFGRDGQLWASIDSGDPSARSDTALLVYVALGNELFGLAERGAKTVAARLGLELPRPEEGASWADYLGWCTWEAFGQEVSEAKLQAGLESLTRAGVSPRFVILDDGWQQVAKTATGEERLVGFDANSKFRAGLAASVRAAKEQHGVRWFFVWHAVHGYWGGVGRDFGSGVGSDVGGDSGAGVDATSEYGVSDRLRWYSPEVLAHMPGVNCEPWGAWVGVPSAEGLPRFYVAYHDALASAGVDGVKVDNQASVEALAYGQGGRVHVAQQMRRALDVSVAEHFAGRVLHCMSCSTDLLYAQRSGGYTRGSMDFAPQNRQAHGVHLDSNALFGIWFGQLLRVDWDMFLSRHEAAELHAAGRALSGGPVYIADAPGQHDVALLGRLTLADGQVLRAEHAGRLTHDCVFEEPAAGSRWIKIWNKNAATAVLGLFHAAGPGARDCHGSFSVADVPGCDGAEYALFLQRAQRVLRVTRDQRVPRTLPALGSEVVSIASIEQGVAGLGLRTHLNGGAAIERQGWANDRYQVHLRCGGDFIAYSSRRATELRVDGQVHPFTQSAEALLATIAAPAGCVLSWAFSPLGETS